MTNNKSLQRSIQNFISWQIIVTPTFSV